MHSGAGFICGPGMERGAPTPSSRIGGRGGLSELFHCWPRSQDPQTADNKWKVEMKNTWE